MRSGKDSRISKLTVMVLGKSAGEGWAVEACLGGLGVFMGKGLEFRGIGCEGLHSHKLTWKPKKGPMKTTVHLKVTLWVSMLIWVSVGVQGFQFGAWEVQSQMVLLPYSASGYKSTQGFSRYRYSPPLVDRIWGIWGSHYNCTIPTAICYLLIST